MILEAIENTKAIGGRRVVGSSLPEETGSFWPQCDPGRGSYIDLADPEDDFGYTFDLFAAPGFAMFIQMRLTYGIGFPTARPRPADGGATGCIRWHSDLIERPSANQSELSILRA